MTPQEFKAKWSTPSGNERQTYRSTSAISAPSSINPHPPPPIAPTSTTPSSAPSTTATGARASPMSGNAAFSAGSTRAQEEPRCRLHPAPRLQGRARKSAPARRLGHQADPHPHQLHQPGKMVHRDPGQPDRRAAEPRDPRFLFTSRGCSERRTRPTTSPGSRRPIRPIATSLQARGEEPHADRPLPGPAPLLPLRRGRRHPAPRPRQRLLAFTAKHPEQFLPAIAQLLSAMESGGYVNYEEIPRVNGGLFRDITPIPLEQAELATLAEAARLDWCGVEPAIFGTLFERSLDPGSRAKLGAHYTGRPDILRVVEPVVMTPLRRALGRGPGRSRHAESGLGCRPARPEAGQRAAPPSPASCSRFRERAGRGPHPRSGLRLRQLPVRGPRRLLELEKEVIALRRRQRPLRHAARDRDRTSCSAWRSTSTRASWPRS